MADKEIISSDKRKRTLPPHVSDAEDENTSSDDNFSNEIQIMTGTGNIVPIKVEASDMVVNLKLKIHDKLGIPPKQQELVFDDMVLHDAHILAELDIKKESIFKLLHKSRGTMLIDIVRAGVAMTLRVKPSDTVGNVKAKLRGVWEVDELIFNETVLDDSGTLADFNITHGSALTGMAKLFKPGEGMMEIFVNCFTRKTISLWVQPTFTVSELKSMIMTMGGDVPVEEQVLIFNNVVLGDTGILFDFRITEKSTVKLIRKSRGITGSMQIFIKTIKRQTISLEVKPTDNIENIKAMIQGKTLLPCDEQVLIFNDVALHDMDTLAGCNISSDSTLTLMRISTGSMRLLILTPNRKIINLEVPPLDTILDVKYMIQEKECCPPCSQRLFLGKKMLSDAQAVYNIPSGSILELVLHQPFLSNPSF